MSKGRNNMKKTIASLGALLGLLIVLSAGLSGAAAKSPLMGESEKAYALAPENTEVRGLAFDDVSPLAPRLLVLDKSGKIFIYGVPAGPAAGELNLLGTLDLPKRADGSAIPSPRGLAYTRYDNKDL